MPTITTTAEPLAVVAYRVSVRARWNDPWEVVPYLYPLRLSFVAAPQIASAVLECHSGWIIQPDGERTVGVKAPELRDRYVKVEIYGDRYPEEDAEPISVWVGVVRSQEEDASGNLFGGQQTAVRSGVTRYLCVGLEALLDKRPILTAHVEADNDDGYITLRRGPYFNRPHRRRRDEQVPGNRSDETVSIDVASREYDAHVLAADVDAAEPWSALDICRYLITFHGPNNSNPDEALPFAFVANVPGEWYDRPSIDADGRTVKSVLDQLIARQRGIGYTVEYDQQNDVPVLRLFTFTDRDVSFGDYFLPANNDNDDWYVDDAAGIVSLSVADNTVGTVDQVVVRGARAICCATWAKIDGTLAPGWSSTLETEHATAGTDEPGYGAADEFDQEMMRIQARARPRFDRVNRDFVVPADWDGEVKNGENDGGGPYFPDPDDAENPLPWYRAELRFLSHLPLRTEHKYENDRIPNSVTSEHRDEVGWEYRPLFAAMRDAVSDLPNSEDVSLDDYTERWYPLTAVETTLFTEYADRPQSASLRPIQDSPGVAVTMAGGMQDVLSGNVTIRGEMRSMGYALLDTSYLVITAAMPVDMYCGAAYPSQIPGGTLGTIQLIELGDVAQLVYVAPGTVIDCRHGELQRSYGGYLRDDRRRCLDLASFAHSWYARESKTITLTAKMLLFESVRIGHVIMQIGSPPPQWIIARTPITEVTYTFPTGDGENTPPPTTVIRTDFAQLDFVSLFTPAE